MKNRKNSPALRSCLKNRVSQGHDEEDAEALCRHVDAAISNYPVSQPKQPFGSSAQADENNAASYGPGWTSRGTNIGTDRVVKQDPASTANDWARAQKRTLTRGDWKAWREHATRLGLDPDEQDMGWRTIMDRPEQVQSAAWATLQKVFGLEETSQVKSELEANNQAAEDLLVHGKMPKQVAEDASGGSPGGSGGSVSWRGYSAPSMPPCTPPYMAPCAPDEGEMQPQNIQPWQTNMRRKKREKEDLKVNTPPPKRELSPTIAERISINVKTHQASQDGNARGQAQDANQNPGFGFATWSARMVFEMAQRLVGLYPLLKPEELLAMAIKKSGVLTTELTPEDDKMLKMAIDWVQNGAAKTNIRTGGAPGGPFRSTGDSHSTNVRGTFGL